MDSLQINKLGQALRGKARELTEIISQISTDTQPVELDQQSVGRVSRIDAIQQQQMAIATQAQAQQQLIEVELALTRIANGDYGYCLECGEPVATARLQVQPFVKLCIDCQSNRETK
jgi:DnaK suppressor protein